MIHHLSEAVGGILYSFQILTPGNMIFNGWCHVSHFPINFRWIFFLPRTISHSYESPIQFLRFELRAIVALKTWYMNSLSFFIVGNVVVVFFLWNTSISRSMEWRGMRWVFLFFFLRWMDEGITIRGGIDLTGWTPFWYYKSASRQNSVGETVYRW